MIFLDTSFIAAYYNNVDVHHKKSLEIMDRILSEKEVMVISDHVFDEIVNVLLNRLKNTNKIKEIGEDLRKYTKMIYTGKENFGRAWEIFKEQKNNSFSFTDCSILSLMEERKIKDIATFDKEFKDVENIKCLRLIN